MPKVVLDYSILTSVSCLLYVGRLTNICIIGLFCILYHLQQGWRRCLEVDSILVFLRGNGTFSPFSHSRTAPFANGPGDSPELILKRIGEGKLCLTTGNWKSVSKEAKVSSIQSIHQEQHLILGHVMCSLLFHLPCVSAKKIISFKKYIGNLFCTHFLNGARVSKKLLFCTSGLPRG